MPKGYTVVALSFAYFKVNHLQATRFLPLLVLLISKRVQYWPYRILYLLVLLISKMTSSILSPTATLSFAYFKVLALLEHSLATCSLSFAYFKDAYILTHMVLDS